MAKSDLSKMLDTVSLKDLKSLVTAKEKLDKLLKKKSSLEMDLSALDKQIGTVQRTLGKAVPKTKAAVKKTGTAKKRKKSKNGRRKKSQASIESLIVEILQEKKKPLSVNEISDILLKEKGYKTKSANFKNQLRVLLYRNQKGTFKKVGTGKFGLAGSGKVPVAVKKVVKKKAVTKKKAASKKKTSTKKKVDVKKKSKK